MVGAPTKAGMIVVIVLSVVALVPAAARSTDDADGWPIRTVPRPGRVALTFDDGPNPTWTPAILDLLDEYRVKATFFVNGFRLRDNAEIAREVVRRGHSLQNHGYGHQRMTELGNEGARREVVRGAEVIFEATGVVTTCFRPGWGFNNARTRRITAEAHHATLLWTIDTSDYAHQSAEGSIREVLEKIRPGSIVLMHDSIGWAALGALPTIIEAVRAAGMDFDTLCDDRPLAFPVASGGWRHRTAQPDG